MVRVGQSSEKAALVYRHSPPARQKEVAAARDARVRAERHDVADGEASAAELVRRETLD